MSGEGWTSENWGGGWPGGLDPATAAGGRDLPADLPPGTRELGPEARPWSIDRSLVADDWSLDPPDVRRSWYDAQAEARSPAGGLLSSIGRAIAGLVGFQPVVEQDPKTGLFSAESRWGPYATGEHGVAYGARSAFNALNPVPGLSVQHLGRTGWGDRYAPSWSPVSAALDVGTAGLSRGAQIGAGFANRALDFAGLSPTLHGPGVSIGGTGDPTPEQRDLGIMVAGDFEGGLTPSRQPTVATPGLSPTPPDSWFGEGVPLWMQPARLA
jgi:hypothetical protein